MESAGASGDGAAGAGEDAAKPHEEEARLATADVPEEADGVVAGIEAESAASGGIHKVDEAAVIGLLEMVEAAAKEEVGIQLAAKGAKLGAGAAKDGFGHAESATETCDDAADGGDLDVSGSVADEEDAALAEAALDGDPAAIGGDESGLITERFEAAPFEEALEVEQGGGAGFTDEAESAAGGGFRDEPVEIGSVLGNEPDADGVWVHIGRERDECLNERDGGLRRPASGTSDEAGDAIAADDDGSEDLLFAGRGKINGMVMEAERKRGAFRGERGKAAAEAKDGAGGGSAFGEGVDEAGPLDDEVWILEGELGGAAIGE